MVEITLPKNSRVKQGKTWDRPESARHLPGISHLPVQSGYRRKPGHRHLFRRHGRLRADGSRRADLDQEQHRSDPDLPTLVPRGRLRFLCDEHRRHQHAGLYPGDGGYRGADRHLSAAAPAGGQGPGSRSHQLLRPAPLDRAVAADRDRRRRKASGGNRRRSGKSSTASTSASCAPAARPRARPTGGTATAISGRRCCCRPIAG